MTDCYWGGEDDKFYYEVDTGRIIGRVEKTVSGNYDAYYKETIGNPYISEYIDDTRARKAVEAARKREQEIWKRRREAWNADHAPVVEQPLAEPKKTWWKIWE